MGISRTVAEMTWDDYQAVGLALQKDHPNVNYLAISDAELRRLVQALPDFRGPAEPADQGALTAIRFAWIAVAEGDDDSGPYDGAG